MKYSTSDNMLGYSLIKTSIRGNKPVNQDAILTYEDENYVFMSLADGLGTAKHSEMGAREICRCVIKAAKSCKKTSSQLSIPSILYEWSTRLKKKGYNLNDCQTTNSFVFVNKKDRRVLAASIGDCMIGVVCDDHLDVLLPEKDFSNLTDCIGENICAKYRVHNYMYAESLRVLIASDGICDELKTASLAEMIEYLCSKYLEVALERRNRQLACEVRRTFSKLNSDDKSLILLWNQKLNKV